MMKIFLIGAVLAGLCGIGAFALKEGVEAVGDISDDIGWGRGGCHGGSSNYGEDNEQFSHCHDEDYSEGDDGYCPYHDEYFTEEEWEEHIEDCPMND